MIPSFCCAAPRADAPVDPCNFDRAAASWSETPSVAASSLTSACKFNVTTPDCVETTAPPPFSTFNSCLCAATLAATHAVCACGLASTRGATWPASCCNPAAAGPASGCSCVGSAFCRLPETSTLRNSSRTM